MKKVTFFILSLVGALLSGCGTTHQYASADSWEDGIYYRRDSHAEESRASESQKIQELIDQTRKEAQQYTQTIIVTDSTPVNIVIEPDWCNCYSYNQWAYWGPSWSLYWDPFWYPSYWGAPWGVGFHYGYYGWYGWYDPWYYGWYDPWYYPPYPVYPVYPHYAYHDPKPVIYGKRDGKLGHSSGSAIHRDGTRNIRNRDESLAQNIGRGDRIGAVERQKGSYAKRENSGIVTGRPRNDAKFRKSQTSPRLGNDEIRSNVGRDFRTNNWYRDNSNTRNNNSTGVRNNQRSGSSSGYNRSSSYGQGSSSFRGSASGGRSGGGGGRARR